MEGAVRLSDRVNLDRHTDFNFPITRFLNYSISPVPRDD
jgi:hypothetical protein